MISVPDLIARWRAKTLSGTGLMRGLVAWDAWDVPISEAAVATALVEQALPALQLGTGRDGKACLLIYSGAEAYAAYRAASNTSAVQHFVTLTGRTLFAIPMDGVEQLWIDPLSPYDIYYDADQIARLRAYAAARSAHHARAR